MSPAASPGPAPATTPQGASADLPIGVFDSGVGGLTVMQALAARLPGEDLLYLGDTARVPYGARSGDTVRRYSHRVAGHLWRRGIKALVVACNTATTWALPSLAAAGAALGVPVLGVIEPGVERALAVTRNRYVAVIGTEGTVRGGAYTRALLSRAPDLRVDALACPLFVALAEEGWHEGDIADRVAQRYLEPLAGGADTLILGCTHYPLLAGAIRKALPGVALVDSARSTAEATAGMLAAHQLLRASGGGSQRFLVTDHVERFHVVGERFLGGPLGDVELVDIRDDDGEAFGLPGSGHR
ncbi:MAG: glutamate racemase [Pseudomonadota bacterium]